MPDKEKSGWKNQRERAATGDYDLVLPFDLILLEALPKEGELFGGLYPIGMTSNEFQEKPEMKSVPLSAISARLAALKAQGLAVKVRTLGNLRGNAYQSSKAGQSLARKLRNEEKSDGETQ